jgi:hypothetical protein
VIQIKNLRNSKIIHSYDIRADRKTVYGNPYFMDGEWERDSVCDDYDRYFIIRMGSDPTFRAEIDRLVEIYKQYGKLNLFCWCVPRRCHVETIKKYIERVLKGDEYGKD